MSNNFLLSKISVLALTAIVLNSLVVSAWSMGNDEAEAEDINPSTIRQKIPNKENELTLHLDSYPVEIITHIIKYAAFNVGAENKPLNNLAIVCKQWRLIVNNEDKTTKNDIKKAWDGGRYDWVYRHYSITDPQEKEIFEKFYNGALIYRPTEGSDEGMVILLISGLRNPLEGTFNLSQCGHAGQYFSISTGYRKRYTPANAEKAEMWFTPWFLVDKEMAQLSPNHHIREISEKWDATQAPVAILWTWGGWDAANEMSYCDSFTAESMGDLGSKNLFNKMGDSERHGYGRDISDLVIYEWQLLTFTLRL